MGQFMKEKLHKELLIEEKVNTDHKSHKIQLQMPSISTVLGGFMTSGPIHEISTCGSRTHEE